MEQIYLEYWNEAMKLIELEMSSVAFETWIKRLKFTKVENNTFHLETFDIYTKELLDHRFLLLIQNSVMHATGGKYTAKIVIPSATINVGDNRPDFNRQFSRKYTFDNFIIGRSNEIAHAASVAVAEAPGIVYNPLFLYGGVGLGKTHLMLSIANYILEQNPNAKVVYATSEKFTNELIEAIRDKKNEEFRKKYRNVDVLLVDDIQFLSDKERTQEEFFHTFNDLYADNKQIILSSDRLPRDIEILEERLRSRFASGLTVDVQRPDLETRAAILKKKADSSDVYISDDVIYFIAKNVVANIRELEGALTKIAAYGKLVNGKITVDIAERELKALLDENANKIITVDYIMEVVALHYNLKPDDLRSKRRTQNISYPRQIAMYLSRKLLDLSLPKIGNYFGGRDHTTILHGCEKIANELEKDITLQQNLSDLEKKISGQK